MNQQIEASKCGDLNYFLNLQRVHEECLVFAAQYGQTECLKLLCKKELIESYDHSFSDQIYEKHIDLVVAAAVIYDQVDCLDYLLSIGRGNLTYATMAVENNSPKCLARLNPPHDRYLVESAITCGNSNILKWLLSRGIPLEEEFVEYAVDEKQLECVKVLIEMDCPWYEEVLDRSEDECVDYLRG